MEVLVLALLDRLRGGFFSDGETWRKYLPGWLYPFQYVRPWMWALCMGVVLGYHYDYHGLMLAQFALGYWVGEGRGWGGPLGRALGFPGPHKIHSWQIGPLAKDHWLALLARGAIWGGFVALFTWGEAMEMIPIMAVSMWLSAQLGKHFEIERGNRWGSTEWFRGGIVGLFGLIKEA